MNKVKIIIRFETELNTPEELKDLSRYIERRLNLRNLDIELTQEKI